MLDLSKLPPTVTLSDLAVAMEAIKKQLAEMSDGEFMQTIVMDNVAKAMIPEKEPDIIGREATQMIIDRMQVVTDNLVKAASSK